MAPATPAAPTTPADATPATPATAATPASAAGATTTAAAPTGETIKMVAGHSQMITLGQPAGKVSIGNADVADVNTLSRTTLLLTAKKGGSTGLIVIDDQGRSAMTEVVVEPDYSALRRQLAESFPGVRLDVTALNDSIGVRGLVPSVRVAEQVIELAGAYGKVHNFVEVAGGQQIMLHIRFAEVSKSAVRQLGVNFGGTDGVSAVSTTAFGGGTNVFSLPAAFGGTEAFSAASFAGAAGVNGVGRFGHTPFDYFITALEENGLVRMLAEPNVVAINGQEGSFVAGGEIPIPISQGGGSGAGAAVTVEYKEYGIKLNYTPLILGDGRVRLKVAPEVSSLDEANAVRANGFDIPAITKRKVSTDRRAGRRPEPGAGRAAERHEQRDERRDPDPRRHPGPGDAVPVDPVPAPADRAGRHGHAAPGRRDQPRPDAAGPRRALAGAVRRGVYFNHDLGGPIANSGSVESGPMKSGRPVVGAVPAVTATPAARPVAATTPPPVYRGTYGFAPAAGDATAAAR